MERAYRLHYAPDNASLIVRLVLEELALPHTCVLVDRARQEQRSPAYLRLNPNGLIPVLETPDGILFETGAILLWLADRHGALAPPPGSRERAEFLKWLFFLANTVHADLRTLFYAETYVGNSAQAQAALHDTQSRRLARHLELLNGLVDAQWKWLNADSPSVLCFYLACLMRWMALYPRDADRSWYDIADYPHLLGLMRALETRPNVIACAKAEGLGPTVFTHARLATPPEGSAV